MVLAVLLLVGAVVNAVERFGCKRHVAPRNLPLVMLLGEHSAHQAHNGRTVGEDPNDVRTSSDLLVQTLLWVVTPDLPPMPGGKVTKRE